MSFKSANKRQESLKQGTLSFATVKRVGSSNATSKSKNLKPTKPAPTLQTSNSADDSDDVELFFSEDEDEDEDEFQDSSDASEDPSHTKPTSPGLRAQTRAADKLTTIKKSSRENQPVATAIANLSTVLSKAAKARSYDTSKAVPGISADEIPELNIKDRKWNKHHAEVRKKMGHLPPVHADNQNKIHEILRVFDLSYEFGPCVGIPRLERWERAQALGLNPPKEVYDILNTKQGSTLDEYSQSVFHNQV